MPPTIKKLAALTPAELLDKRVWLRVDFNVAIVAGVVTEGYRIDRSLETIKFLQTNGAKIILGTHLGDGTASLAPVVEYLKTKINLDNITILPNLRSNPGEESNSEALAEEWAASADLYVNEAFAVSHRPHASIVGLPKFLPAYAGFNLVAEVENLSKCFVPVHPALLVVGGAKLESKKPVIDKFKSIATDGQPLVDHVLIGGKLVYDFLNNTDPQIVMSKELVRDGDKIVDVVVTEEIKALIKNSRRIIWAGPMGMYDAGYPQGTLDLAKVISESEVESIIGGGDTLAAIPAELWSKFTFVSTGGGPMLQFLAEGTLPGVEALK